RLIDQRGAGVDIEPKQEIDRKSICTAGDPDKGAPLPRWGRCYRTSRSTRTSMPSQVPARKPCSSTAALTDRCPSGVMLIVCAFRGGGGVRDGVPRGRLTQKNGGLWALRGSPGAPLRAKKKACGR